jgi:putative membrane-bound dehydrogenase-like protein
VDNKVDNKVDSLMKHGPWLLMLVVLFSGRGYAQQPQVRDPRLTLTLVAREPEIVTPIGITVDDRGRLLVIESHTHFPPDDYSGPTSDRLRWVEDTDGDGQADRFRTFFEGTKSTMSVAQGSDSWIYVATRMEIFRVRDTDADDVADQRQLLVRLDTTGNYPHNGLCGLAFAGDGSLYFGLGENLGVDYRLIGSDGRTLQGGGEGGNIYQCDAAGRGLRQIATGFWNPFGICVDPLGRIFTVENDPDASPPCRLLHIVHGGDYGYQFRYGRPGRHPLQAWNGEFPGTLPMVAGTGEAPSDVLPWHGALWVTSWGDHRIERFALRPSGASFVAASETVVQGDENFRPVDFCLAADGSLLFSDWVDKSYPVHGKGRIWRLAWKDGQAPAAELPPLSVAEKRAATLEQTLDIAAWDDVDPFLRQAAVWKLSEHRELAPEWNALKSARQRLALLQAERWHRLQGAAPRLDWLEHALQDDDADVRLYAVRSVADARLMQFRASIEKQLTWRGTTPQLFQAALAAIEWLDRGEVSKVKDPSYEQYLLDTLADARRPIELRTIALRLLPPDHPQLALARLQPWLESQVEPATFRRAALRSLVLRDEPAKSELLARIAGSEEFDAQQRADAVAGLAPFRDQYAALLMTLAESTHEPLAKEARRVVRLAAPQPQQISPPTPEEITAWQQRIGNAGDADAGWRVFFSDRGRCAGCHRFDGRGSNVGPDLTLAGTRMSRERILVSLLDPSREIAPQFVSWALETDDGRVLAGVPLGSTTDGRGERFLGPDGREFVLPASSIVARRATNQSIMPSGLAQSLDIEDLRNLLALLSQESAE